jgi:exonuclease VII small subunit
MADDSKTLSLFHRSALYPDAEGIFAFRPKSLVEIRDDSFVVLDTNSLLVPYTIGKETLEQIETIYKALVDAKRLLIPGQVTREFAEHRVTKLKELYQQISRKTASIDLGSYPLLGSLKEYQKALELERNLHESLRAYNKAINEILVVVSGWYWDDPVSRLYAKLFASDVVFDPEFDKDEIKQRLERDILHKVPPGYKDARKEDQGIGDLLIWRTILEIGKANKKSTIFVSSDQKADWWSYSEGRPLYPRFELIDEFRRVSGGQSFHAIKFSKFLDLFGATKDVVEEVRKEERQASLFHAEHGPAQSYEAYVAQNAVYDWLAYSYPNSTILRNEASFPDYVVIDQESKKMAVEIKYFREAHVAVRRFKEFASHIATSFDSDHFDSLLIVLVGINEEAAHSLANEENRFKEVMQWARVVIGFLASPSGEFIEYPPDENL